MSNNNSEIKAAYILPHGALALTPYKYPNLTELADLHKSCVIVGDEIYSLRPDIILLITPHGINLSNNYGIYLNSKASGTAEWKEGWKEYKVDVDIELELSKSMLEYFRQKGEKKYTIEGITTFSESEAIPLRWGECVPLWFLKQPYINYTMIEEKFPKCVFMSIPTKRNSEIEKMTSQLITLGNDIAEYFNTTYKNKNVVIVISGDLSHMHITKQNLTTTSTQDEADKLDKSLEIWANDPIGNEKLLLQCSEIVNIYLSCGYPGFLILQGILKYINTNAFNSITSSVLCNYHPTYYGMMVAKFNFLKKQSV